MRCVRKHNEDTGEVQKQEQIILERESPQIMYTYRSRAEYVCLDVTQHSAIIAARRTLSERLAVLRCLEVTAGKPAQFLEAAKP